MCNRGGIRSDVMLLITQQYSLINREQMYRHKSIKGYWKFTILFFRDTTPRQWIVGYRPFDVREWGHSSSRKVDNSLPTDVASYVESNPKIHCRKNMQCRRYWRLLLCASQRLVFFKFNFQLAVQAQGRLFHEVCRSHTMTHHSR